LDTVKKLVVFFKRDGEFINSKEPGSGNTALHFACRNGHLDVIQHLLENGADINSRNHFQNTPLFLAIESLNRAASQLLIEWQANVNAKNRSSKTALELLRNAELKQFLMDKYQQCRKLVLAVRQGNLVAVTEALLLHARRESTFANLRSRCIGGDTLFHVAASTGNSDAIETLIQQNVDCNVLNDQGATPLHVAKDASTIEILVGSQGHVNATDCNGNTALHIKCLGKAGQATETDCITTLVYKGASLTLRNDRGLMPIHCCAERGRADAIRLLLERDREGKIQRALERESDAKPPSLLHLAVSNDFYQCSDWLSQNGFIFKEFECDRLMLGILKQEIECSTPTETIQLLIQNGASVNKKYEEGNTSLHLAVEHCSSSDAVEVLIVNGADVNALNDDRQTALFLATSGSQPYTASLLLKAGIDFRHKDRRG
jgi:ankyrin repeat protein